MKKMTAMIIMMVVVVMVAAFSAEASGLAMRYVDSARYPEVQKAYEAGIVRVKGRYFRPNAVITRAEFAGYLRNALGYKGAEDPMMWLYSEALARVPQNETEVRQLVIQKYYAGLNGKYRNASSPATLEFASAMVYLLKNYQPQSMTIYDRRTLEMAATWATVKLNRAGYVDVSRPEERLTRLWAVRIVELI